MGGIFQFLDFNQNNTSRKLSAQKRNLKGLEAPRNSLEFPMEASQSYNGIQEDIPYSCQVKQNSSKTNFYRNETPIKKLIDEEVSKGANNRRYTPSVVARLMGMDTFPSEIKPTIHVNNKKDEESRVTLPRKVPSEIYSSHYASSHTSTPFMQVKQDFVPYATKRDSSQPTNSLRSTKPNPREHPQEELLQKFKKEFESWQASKVWETSRALELDNNLCKEKVNQKFAVENLNKEKMARYLDAKRDSGHKKPKDYDSTAKLKIGTEHENFLQCEEYMSKQRNSDLKNGMTLWSREGTGNFTQFSSTKFDKKQDRSSSPTRIVILKPSSEMSDYIEESCAASPDMLEKEGSMENFLEEVKERLKSEILGKVRNKCPGQDFGTDTFFNERSAGRKQFAQRIARQIRDNVTTDLGTTLIRSESTRSYRSEVQFNGPGSPEFINRDTRSFLSERLKNVLNDETSVDIPLAIGRSKMVERVRSRSMHDYSKLRKNESYWEDKKTLAESETRCFRHDRDNEVAFDAEQLSPRNLVRSFSAPVSGTAFGKLLLEDQHVLTGAHIRRKHEASQHSCLAESRKKRKDGFNIKGTVSNLRQNLNLRGKLFRKKIDFVDELAAYEFDPMKAIVTTPSALMNFGPTQDNSTEVPPSPASVCSSHDEYCRPSHSSPVSPLEVPFAEDCSEMQASTDISSNLSEIRNLSEEQVEHGGFEEVDIQVKPSVDGPVDVIGQAEAYLRDILMTAGLYEGRAFDQAFSMCDALSKPISNWVFEEVEDAYSKKQKVDEGGLLLCCGDTNLDHKLLFDLTNEALPRVLKTSVTGSTFTKWVLGQVKVPHGKTLLDDLWHQIKMYISPPKNGSSSLDSMVVRDVRTAPWFSVLHEDLDDMGREMELVILEYLIDEFVREMWLQ